MREYRKMIKACDRVLQLGDAALKYADLLNHLKPCGNDLVLLTLKGHLIIEHLLEMNLTHLLSVDCLPEGKDNPELEFSQKLKLVQAATLAREVGPNADLFCVITKLNKIRNMLAHNLLADEEIKREIKKVIESYQAKTDSKLDSDELPQQFRNCILKLAHFLLKVRVHFDKLSQEED
jgi:hypothetical protein